MVARDISGSTTLERLRRRYESTEKKCPECGFVDATGNWTSQTDGSRIVYRHVCPSCDASHEHVFDLER